MPSFPPTPDRPPDILVLSRFIYEFNIARRQMSAYPKGHPVIAAAAGKTMEIFASLLENCDEVTLGVAREVLVVGEACLERKNPVFQDLARHLFALGVASLTFSRGLTRGEIITFNELLSHSREEVREAGGLALLLEGLGIRNIAVEEIDYQAFATTEELRIFPPGQNPAAPPAIPLWEGFITALLHARLDPEGAPLSGFEELGAGAVAALLNDEFDPNPANYGASIVAFLRRLAPGQSDDETRSLALEKLADLVGRFNPELRCQFLSSTFGALSDEGSLATEFIQKLSPDRVAETLADINDRRLSVPPAIFGILQKLSRHGGDPGGKVTGGTPSTGEDASESLDLIFREVEADQFVPAGYQVLLDKILTVEQPRKDEGDKLEELKKTLGSHRVETKVSAIILEILNNAPSESQTQSLKRNTLELFDYFLEMGDFASLSLMHTGLRRGVGAEAPLPLHQELLAAFTLPRFLEGTLNAPSLWGKEKFEEIEALIAAVGLPFVEPLLDRLAAADTIPLRRYYMERLQAFGNRTLPAIRARLGDGRWFFVRNLIMMLRTLNDPAVAAEIKPLLNHPHPKVRQEAFATLLHFRAPGADRILLEMLGDNDPAEQLRAVLLAPRTPYPAVFRALLALLNQGILTGSNFELKRGVVQALAETGNPAALPELGRRLRSNSLFHPILHARLKLEIVKSLEYYPAAEAAIILAEVVRSGSGDLARTAAQTLKNLQGRGA
ncbi:HEAT-like repeat-containing protein [Desulfuromonas soudanensis]|uniref:HEAT-like repeat-containing protein n=1 Tax=Desulfuromonas soudanensis TaxID=1603606 RepID=A0A0M4D5Q7_9BACT|nr:HEAT repeat domain-containing protein [Desulfuromonas soudanensis]ALC18226.1 HEAT-like repeat-containing protein [Desulfuromonas soudanensis]